MTQPLVSASIAIISIVVYQIGMKSVPAGLNPANVLVTIFLSALACTVVFAKAFSLNESFFSLSEYAWQPILIGVAIVGIELGYLLMYRSGWSLAAAPLVGMGSAAVLLAVISVIIFKEPLSFKNICGIFLCIGGLYLLTSKT